MLNYNGYFYIFKFSIFSIFIIMKKTIITGNHIDLIQSDTPWFEETKQKKISTIPIINIIILIILFIIMYEVIMR